ncbi:MAG TPA: class I SAM-dependent methyltransferase [Rhodoblastus sp.]|nr:class I SAM-dependent methyltransferase [Rhodoblastus sp.]
MKVNLFRETKICCSFFTKLPQFDWPSAKEFHDPGGMWNHPFMQHMRRTMRTRDEVPYCTLCMDMDKRDPTNKELLDTAIRKSLEIFRELQPTRRVNGRIDEIETPLPRWTMFEIDPLSNEILELKPFSNEKHEYREAIHKFGFEGLSDVLLITDNVFRPNAVGMASHVIAPFLAESNARLSVAGASRAFAARLCAEFGLDAHPVDGTIGEPLPFADHSLDAIWMHGKLLAQTNFKTALHEFRRVLRPGGLLHVRRAPGIGAQLRIAMRDTRLGDGLWSRIRRGQIQDGDVAWFSRRNLDAMLAQGGFSIDRLHPLTVQAKKADALRMGLAELPAADFAQRLTQEQLRVELRANPALVDGLEEFITFNARAHAAGVL